MSSSNTAVRRRDSSVVVKRNPFSVRELKWGEESMDFVFCLMDDLLIHLKLMDSTD